jgi:hypothetical protein
MQRFPNDAMTNERTRSQGDSFTCQLIFWEKVYRVSRTQFWASRLEYQKSVGKLELEELLYQLNAARSREIVMSVELLCSSPHFIHARLDVVSIWFGAVWSSHVRCAVIHLTHLGLVVWVRVWIHIVTLPWRWHVL